MIIDDREDKKMLEYLLSMRVGFTKRRMDVCDYVVGGRIGIERKTVDDFCGSIMDGRLSRQVENMKEVFDDVLVLVSGKINDRVSEIHENCIVGKIVSLYWKYGASIVMLDNDKQLAYFLKRLEEREMGAK